MKWNTTLYNVETREFEEEPIQLYDQLEVKVHNDLHEMQDSLKNDDIVDIDIHDFTDDQMDFIKTMLVSYGYLNCLFLEFIFQTFREHNEELYDAVVQANHHDPDAIQSIEFSNIHDCVRCQHAIGLMMVSKDLPLIASCSCGNEEKHSEVNAFAIDIQNIPEDIGEFLEKFGGEDNG